MRIILYLFLLPVLITSCTVTFITGYDEVLDSSVTEIKRDYNRHFIKLERSLNDNIPGNNAYADFVDYYDDLEVDLLMLKDRTKYLGEKSERVKQQVANLDAIMQKIIQKHREGKYKEGNSYIDERNAVNSAIDAITLLQEQLRTSGKIKK